MWWIWLVPSLVVAGALLAVAVTALDTWHRYTALRAALDALGEQARRAEDIVTGIAPRA